jgi:hypothetical protein
MKLSWVFVKERDRWHCLVNAERNWLLIERDVYVWNICRLGFDIKYQAYSEL